MALALVAALAAGRWMEPSPTGTGTHTQIGLAPCGMLIATGHPCPTCGVTTSFALAAHGRLGESLVNQPFGLLVFLMTVGGLAVTVVTLVTGRSWGPSLTPGRLIGAVLALLLAASAAWAYKWHAM